MPDLPLQERRQLSDLESALMVEIRRSNDALAAEFRRLADHWIGEDEKTDPARRALREEVDSWPMRLRVLLGKFLSGAWDKFQQPIAMLITMALAYYGLRFTGQTPTPTPVQVQQVAPAGD